MSSNINDRHAGGIDVPIVKLVPRTECQATKKYYDRIKASMVAVGLLEPLIVCPVGDTYEILDGSLRYHILLDLGATAAPCTVVNLSTGEENHE